MEQSQKILSIIIPAYNCSKTIVNTLNSIDFTNESKFEVLIIDDGSTEDIYPLIKPIIDAHPNTVKYFKKQNGNWGSVLNYGVRVANGIWIKILDSDDTFDTGVFNSYFKYLILLEKQSTDLLISSYSFYFTNKNYFENRKNPHSRKKRTRTTSFDKIRLTKVLSHHSLTFKKTLFEKFIPLLSNIYYTDTIFIYQCVLFSQKITFLPNELFLYQYHVSSSEQSISMPVFTKNLNQVITVYKELLNIPIPENISAVRKKTLVMFIKLFLYLIILVIALDDKTFNWQKKIKVKIMLNYLAPFSSDHDFKKNLNYGFLRMVKNFNHNFIMLITKFTYSVVWWGFIAATKPNKNKK